jgi:hypothetical protein
MKNLGKFILAGTLALSGCTAKERCENNLPIERDYLLHKGALLMGTCNEISNPAAAQECSNLIKQMRESAMSACLTKEYGIATTCTEKEKKFDCAAKK